MIQVETWLQVADNTGAQQVECFRILGGFRPRYARVGDVIICAVKQAQPHGMVKKGDVVRAVIVRQAKEMRRPDGTYIRFSENACVIVEKNNEPKGTRIFGPIAREVKQRGFAKIASLAPEVL
ncbi:MAG: 50S ribosomal protein L14 [Candidatus Kerfeldbacteria bacterium]|nr:50S ribosomal protein L14 [Candidatus Kerfeldbacteria bacterium]